MVIISLYLRNLSKDGVHLLITGGDDLKILEDKILKDGRVMPGNILNVGSFLNQQLDPALLMSMGQEVARLFSGKEITKILTIEASGIAVAVTVGSALNVPVLFAKKHRSGNVAGSVYKTTVHSYTHGNDYEAVVPSEYLYASDKVLLVDDFLANGAALRGLISLVEQAGAELVGAAVAIEKGFQKGGDDLRAEGVRVESLAIIDRFENGTVVFRS